MEDDLNGGGKGYLPRSQFMPNYVTNVIKSKPQVISKLLCSDGSVDFNKIIRMPSSLSTVTCNGDDRFVDALAGVTKELDESIFSLSSDRFENVVNMMRNYYNYKYATWYTWRIDNWGTKWNAHDTRIVSSEVVEFTTAWSPPHKVIAKLAAKFPAEDIEHLWADEDIGYNLGSRRYRGDIIIDRAIDNPKDFAISLIKNVQQYYKFNTETNSWEEK